jgi:phosphoribosyl-ATP pyrophosphohydrolase
MMPEQERGCAVLDRVYAVIESRRGADPVTSFVAQMFADGRQRIAQKIGEEAVETVIAAAAGDRDETVRESADLLFFLMVLWSDMGIQPDDVFAELSRREGVSGIDEKSARGATWRE